MNANERPAMTESNGDELPELPMPAVTYADHSYPAYSKRQMQAYAREAVRAALAALAQNTQDDRAAEYRIAYLEAGQWSKLPDGVYRVTHESAGTTKLVRVEEPTQNTQGDGGRPLPWDRDTLGRMVREAWVRWAEQQPEPKPSWLVPYEQLDDSDKEADRQIGEAIARWALIGDAAQTVHAERAEVPAESWTGEIERCDAKGFWLVLADNCPFVPGQRVTIAAAPSPPTGQESGE